ncbi:histone-lysine N-methyltransferase SETMAR [Trichonephila clavipes]|nr:histone-lysine N-methyltransferase SETMAR [Trichonephila clavipes]
MEKGLIATNAECLDRLKDILLQFLKSNIKEGNTFISDCWKAYNCLEDKDFLHFSVNPEMGTSTNSIEDTPSSIKKSLHRTPRYFDVKDAPRTGRSVVENVDKITEIIEVDRLVSSRSITQELKIDHKTVLRHLSKVELKKKLHVWVPHQLTPKT